MQEIRPFFELVKHYFKARRGIEEKKSKFDRGEPLTFAGFNEIYEELYQANEIAEKLYRTNGNINLKNPGSFLELTLGSLVQEFSHVKGDVYTIERYKNELESVEAEGFDDEYKDIIEATRPIIEEAEEHLPRQMGKMDNLALRCDEALKKTFRLYAGTDLVIIIYAYEDRMDKEDKQYTLSSIYYDMFPKGNSVEAYSVAGKSFMKKHNHDLATEAFEKCLKAFESVTEEDIYYDYKKEIVSNIKNELMQVKEILRLQEVEN